jgi:deoxyxylulose-5-phosphate synthase
MTPSDLKSINEEHLVKPAPFVRDKISHTVSLNGVRLAASLGAVEFAAAPLRAFDALKIKFYGMLGIMHMHGGFLPGK